LILSVPAPFEPFPFSLICHFVLIPLLFFYRSHNLPDIHSFPTRRSSDLRRESKGPDPHRIYLRPRCGKGVQPDGVRRKAESHRRSEEHTSELQSRFDLVYRLLLEKKNKYLIIKTGIVDCGKRIIP